MVVVPLILAAAIRVFSVTVSPISYKTTSEAFTALYPDDSQPIPSGWSRGI